MQLVTKRQIEYKAAPPLKPITIPKGTSVIPATNLPDDGKFWAEPWDDMNVAADAWFRSYGFLIDAEDVIIAEE